MSKKAGSKKYWWIAIGLVLVLLVAAALAFKFIRPRRVFPEYNIVLVTFDTTRADRLGCYGFKSARTPNIDTLASQGTRYTNCYSTGPITLPSHTSILTGLYPFRHGLRDNNAGRLSDEAETLPEVLKDAGYKTGAVVAAYVLDSRFGLNQGFDSYDDDLSDANQDSKFHIPERKAAEISASALEWLNSVGDSKYFLWVHYFDPHANYDPPGVKIEGPMTPEKTRQLYDLEIAYADAQLGKVIAKIGQIQESTGRPTLIVVTSDHGESLGDHGEPTHGVTVYNEVIKAPLVIFDSAEANRGVVKDEPVSIVDIMPDLLNRVGLRPTNKIDGRKLPRASGKGKPVDENRPIYFETMMTYNMYGWSPLEGVIQGNDKLIVAPKPEYYDVNQDPLETKDLYEESNPRVESLQAAFDDLKDAPLQSLVVEEAPVDAEATRKLMSLGYVGSVPNTDSEDLPDDLPNPSDLMALHRELLSAQSLVANGRTDRAFEKLSWIILQNPDNNRCLELISNELPNARPPLEPARAIELLQQLIKMRPDSGEHMLAMGKALVAAKEMPKALEAFDEAINLDSENTDALNHYAWFSYKEGKNLETARDRAQQAVDLEPANAAFRHTLSCILLDLDQPQNAVDQLEAALAINPDYAIAHYHLGVAQDRLGSKSEAVSSLEQAIELVRKSMARAPGDSPPDEPEWLPDAKARLSQLQSS